MDVIKDFEFSEIILSNPKIFNMILNFEFYYYECESVNDRGWGSAWRCFQSFLKTAHNYILKIESNYNKSLEKDHTTNLDNKSYYSKLKHFDFSFENLFLIYGERETLDKIYIKKRLGYLEEKLKDLSENKRKIDSNIDIKFLSNEKNDNSDFQISDNFDEFNSKKISGMHIEKELLEKNLLSDFLTVSKKLIDSFYNFNFQIYRKFPL